MSDSELVPKIGTKSVVWEYFGLERGVEGRPFDDGSVVCRSCRRRVLARNGNTSNLLAYLKANHAKIHSEVKAAMSNKVKTSVGSPIKNGHDALQSLEAIDMLPVTPTFLRATHFSSAAWS